MPLYDIRCDTCGADSTIFRRLAEYDNLPACACGGKTSRRLSTPLLAAGFTPYISPATGREISSRNQREDDLKRSNAFLKEPGVEKDILRKRQEAETKAFAPLAAAVDNTVRALVNTGKIPA